MKTFRTLIRRLPGLALINAFSLMGIVVFGDLEETTARRVAMCAVILGIVAAGLEILFAFFFYDPHETE